MGLPRAPILEGEALSRSGCHVLPSDAAKGSVTNLSIAVRVVALSMILMLGCDRDASNDQARLALPVASLQSIGPSRPPPSATPDKASATLLSPEARTRDIARRCALGLPSFQLWSKMCDEYETSAESTRPLKDGWGTEFRVTCDRKRTSYVFTSAGPDGKFRTVDDLELRQLSAPIAPFQYDPPPPCPWAPSSAVTVSPMSP